MSFLGADRLAPGSGSQACPAAGLLSKPTTLDLPHQGKQILIDNLSDRGYGSAGATIAVATRPRQRVRMPRTLHAPAPPSRRGDAHHEYWIERDANRLEKPPSVVAAPAFMAGA